MVISWPIQRNWYTGASLSYSILTPSGTVLYGPQAMTELVSFPGCYAHQNAAIDPTWIGTAVVVFTDGAINRVQDLAQVVNIGQVNGDAVAAAALALTAQNIIFDGETSGGSTTTEIWLSDPYDTTKAASYIGNYLVIPGTGMILPARISAYTNQGGGASSVTVESGKFTVAPDPGTAVQIIRAGVGDLLAFAVPGGYTSGMAGYELGRLATIAGATALISTGGNTFRSPIQNGTIHIPQGMNWTNNTLAAIQILQDGGNWPDLSEYPAAGSNGIFLELSIRPQYTNVAGYNPTNSASFSFACTASGTSPNQIISIRPGTPTANLQPRNDAGDGPNGPPYTAQVWAINGSDEVLLFSGLADVVDNIRS